MPNDWEVKSMEPVKPSASKGGGGWEVQSMEPSSPAPRPSPKTSVPPLPDKNVPGAPGGLPGVPVNPEATLHGTARGKFISTANPGQQVPLVTGDAQQGMSGMSFNPPMADQAQQRTNIQNNAMASGAAAAVPMAMAAPVPAAVSMATSPLGAAAGKAITAHYGGSESAQDIGEAGGGLIGATVGGIAGARVGEPFLQWLTSSKGVGAKLLQMASQKAGTVPVETSPATNEIVDEIVKQGKLGGKVPKVISDFLERVGPSTKIPAEAPPNPLTYDEARILQSNASTLSANEKMDLKGQLRYLIPQFAKSFGRDVQNAADQAGIGTEHAAGMREYGMASARNRALVKAAKIGAAGAGIYGAEQVAKRAIGSVVK